jgi:hypothetical protein
MRHLTKALALMCLWLSPATAQDLPSLTFPVECSLGETCFLQQFVDRDPGPGARDYTCGPQSYDGHTGTDIRTADLAAMARGVAVIAAADGVVRALRDGVPDAGTAAMAPGQGCGNGVVLTHPNGWETQYCHLMEGSIPVTVGMQVAAGDRLGLIGYSGRTEFPHLEFLLRRDGQIVDPFAPSALAGCGDDTGALWSQALDHTGGGILSAGFSPTIPEFGAIKAGSAGTDTLATRADALVLWGYVHSARVGDVLALRITDATGQEVHSAEVTLDRTQAELFRAIGRRTPAGGWPPGRYTGDLRLIRGGAEIDRQTTTVTVTPG